MGAAATSSLTAAELAAWAGLLETHQRLARELDAELEQAHGLSLGDYDVLIQLADAPEGHLRMTELAEAVLITRSGLTRLVDRLERRGLVERVRCPSDGRGLWAALTDAGRARLREARSTHLAGVRRRFLEPLAGEDIEQLAAIWSRLGATRAPGPACAGDDA